MTDKDQKKDSQLSRADDWLNQAIDPVPKPEPQPEEEPKQEEQENTDG